MLQDRFSLFHVLLPWPRGGNPMFVVPVGFWFR